MCGRIYVTGTNLVEVNKVMLNTIYQGTRRYGFRKEDVLCFPVCFFLKSSKSGLENSMLGPVMDCTTPFKSLTPLTHPTEALTLLPGSPSDVSGAMDGRRPAFFFTKITMANATIPPVEIEKKQMCGTGYETMRIGMFEYLLYWSMNTSKCIYSIVSDGKCSF